MKNKMIPVLIIALLMGICQVLQAQSSIETSKIMKDQSAQNWHLLNKSGALTIWYQYMDCQKIEMVNLKIENTSSSAIDASWTFSFSNGDQILSFHPDYLNAKFHLNAGEVMSGSCTNPNPMLSIMVKESVNPARITKVAVDNVHTTVANQ